MARKLKNRKQTSARERRESEYQVPEATGRAGEDFGRNSGSGEKIRPTLLGGEEFGEPQHVAASLAHDLNQPLTAITIYSRACLRILRSEQADTKELTGALEQIAAQAEHAGRLVRTLRDQIITGNSLRMPVQVNAQIKEAVDLCQHRIRAEEVQLRLSLADSLPRVLADPVQLEQVLLNLIHNAIEAMNRTVPEQRVLTIRSSCEEGKVIVTVRDTGPGLAPAIARRLFQPFQTTKPQGMGLGLSLCHSIIQAHRGQIWMQPNEDRGTTFFFSLPCVSGP